MNRRRPEAGDLIAEVDPTTQLNNVRNAEAAVTSTRAQRAVQAANLRQAELAFERQKMMLADEAGAALIVAVGTHATLEEFLDKGRAGMASTFLTRLRVGGKLVDAKGVSRLYRSRISPWTLLLLVAASLLTIVVAAYCSPAGQVYMTFLAARWDAFYYWLTGLFA